MGKGKSSDVYTYKISNFDIARRQFTGWLQPTGASDYTVPTIGLEPLFLRILWKRIPFEIRYREVLEKAPINHQQ